MRSVSTRLGRATAAPPRRRRRRSASLGRRCRRRHAFPPAIHRSASDRSPLQRPIHARRPSSASIFASLLAERLLAAVSSAPPRRRPSSDRLAFRAAAFLLTRVPLTDKRPFQRQGGYGGGDGSHFQLSTDRRYSSRPSAPGVSTGAASGSAVAAGSFRKRDHAVQVGRGALAAADATDSRTLEASSSSSSSSRSLDNGRNHVLDRVELTREELLRTLAMLPPPAPVSGDNQTRRRISLGRRNRRAIGGVDARRREGERLRSAGTGGGRLGNCVRRRLSGSRLVGMKLTS